MTGRLYAISRKASVTLGLLGLLGFLLMAFPAASYGYSCFSIPEPKQALKAYDAVFTGEVLLLREEPTRQGSTKRLMDVRVLSKWKGIRAERISLAYDALSTFEPGAKYIFYAYKSSPDRYIYEYRQGEWVTEGACSRTVPLADAAYDLEQLGPAFAPTERVTFGFRAWTFWLWLSAVGAAASLAYGYRKRLRRKP